MNPLVVPVTGVKFKRHFCMRNEQWIFYQNFSLFGQIKKSLNRLSSLEDIYIKFRKTELVEIS